MKDWTEYEAGLMYRVYYIEHGTGMTALFDTLGAAKTFAKLSNGHLSKHVWKTQLEVGNE